MENFQSDILTVDEAAALLKIPRSSVYRLAQQGKIPARKVGRHWRFHRSVLLRFVAGDTGLEVTERGFGLSGFMQTKEANK